MAWHVEIVGSKAAAQRRNLCDAVFSSAFRTLRQWSRQTATSSFVADHFLRW